MSYILGHGIVTLQEIPEMLHSCYLRKRIIIELYWIKIFKVHFVFAGVLICWQIAARYHQQILKLQRTLHVCDTLDLIFLEEPNSLLVYTANNIAELTAPCLTSFITVGVLL